MSTSTLDRWIGPCSYPCTDLLYEELCIRVIMRFYSSSTPQHNHISDIRRYIAISILLIRRLFGSSPYPRIMLHVRNGPWVSKKSRPTTDDRGTRLDHVSDDSSNAFSNSQGNEEEEKDSTELELEAAVFGDEAGFHERLKRHWVTRDDREFSTDVAKDVQDEVKDDIQDIDDADVCRMIVLVK